MKNAGPKSYPMSGKKWEPFHAEITAAYVAWEAERAQANAGSVASDAMLEVRLLQLHGERGHHQQRHSQVWSRSCVTAMQAIENSQGRYI